MAAASIEQELAAKRATISPRFAPPPTPLRSRLIHGGAFALWVLLFARAFGGGGLFAWSAGLAYIGYDTVLLAFVFWQTLALLRPPPARTGAIPPAATIIVAAHDEAAVLPATLAALFAQTSPAETILIADDGSTDGTAALLTGPYGITMPSMGELSGPSPLHPALRWLRLPHGGKAQALNVAAAESTTELVLTVDADTLLEPGRARGDGRGVRRRPGAGGRHRRAHAHLRAVGVRAPAAVVPDLRVRAQLPLALRLGPRGRAAAVSRARSAATAVRRCLMVGGFDPDCLVEDYELTHRLRDHAGRQGLVWRTGVVGGAHARTDAPATVGAFLRQRRRWFGGFLQTQVWYRHMVGNPAYGRLGTMMLPVKAIDTLQPLYGLTGAVLLIAYLLGGNYAVVAPVAGVIGPRSCSISPSISGRCTCIAAGWVTPPACTSFRRPWRR